MASAPDGYGPAKRSADCVVNRPDRPLASMRSSATWHTGGKSMMMQMRVLAPNLSRESACPSRYIHHASVRGEIEALRNFPPDWKAEGLHELAESAQADRALLRTLLEERLYLQFFDNPLTRGTNTESRPKRERSASER